MKIVRFATVVMIALSMPVPAYAESQNIAPANRPASGKHAHSAISGEQCMRAERGVKNILLGWTEIPKSIAATTTDTGNPVWGLAAGTFTGIGRAFPRTVNGISDVVTSPAADRDGCAVKPDRLNRQIR